MMRWRILGLLFLARVGLGFQFQAMPSVGDDLVRAFDLGYAEIGLLIGLFMAPGLFLALPAGYCGRWAADKHLAVLGLGALALGGLVSSLAADSTAVGAGRIIAGAGFLFSTLYLTKMVADWFDGREIATAMSILVMSWPFGIAMGQVSHAWLTETYGWRVPFLVASFYCSLAAVGLHLFYRAHRELPATASDFNPRLTLGEWRLIFCAASAWGTFNAAYVTYLSFGPKVLEGLGLTAIGAAGIISIGSWLMILSGTVCGFIVDRFGWRNLVLTICMGGAVVSLFLLSLPGAGLSASLLFGLVGMAPAGVIMALVGEAMRPRVRALGMGIFFTIYYAIMLITPPAAGAVFDATGNAQAPIWFAMALFATVVPLALTFRFFKMAPAPTTDVSVEDT